MKRIITIDEGEFRAISTNDLAKELEGNEHPTLRTLSRGTQVITVDRSTPFNVSNIYGRTLVNLLGRIGNCEDISKLTPYAAAKLIADTSSKVYGNQSIIFEINTGKTDAGVQVTVPVKKDKCYVYVADIAKGTLTSDVKIQVFVNGIATNSSGVSSATFKPAYVKFKPSADANANFYAYGTGISGQRGLVDGMRLYEISSADYAALDSMTPDQVATRYPYVDDVKAIQNPYVIRYGADGTTIEDYLFLQTNNLHSNVDRTVYDEIFVDANGKHRKRKWFEEVVLDGDKIKTFTLLSHSGGTNYKSFRFDVKGKIVPVANVLTMCTKYDGTILKPWAATETADQVWTNYDSSEFYLTVSNADSGWGDGYTPTVAEILAYFYGWKMYAGNTGNSGVKYDGTAGQTKAWCWLDGTNFGVTTTPTVQASTSYKLVYQRMQSVEEPVIAEGSISLHAGTNVLEIGEGLILREPVFPQYSTTVYEINRSSGNISAFKNKSNKVLVVYKNDIKNTKWRIQENQNTGYWNGTAGADIPVVDYDSTAAYSATYLILDRYAFTASLDMLTAEYSANMGNVVSELSQDMADIATRLSIAETTKANRQQGQWLPAVLQNGWIPYDYPNYPTSEYMKDEFGIVHVRGLIKAGAITDGTVIFILPAKYRPKYRMTFVCWSHDGTKRIPCGIDVKSSGEVLVYTSGNGFLSLNQVTFQAEQ